MTVDASGQVPELHVSLSPVSILLSRERIGEAGDLERCLARSWLDGLG